MPTLFAQRADDPTLAERVHFIAHHRCHAACAFYGSPFRRAAVLVVDGIGEDATAWLGVGRDSQLQRLEEIPYPHSIGLLWERAAVYCGLGSYDAGKLMGLAAHGDPAALADTLTAMFAVPDPDGGQLQSAVPPFVVDPQLARLRSAGVEGFEQLFGPRNSTGTPEEGSRFADLAAALQRRTDEALLAIVRRLHRASEAPCLAYAGGVALNCVSNALIEREGPFAELYIPGAAHDAGCAIGAAFELAFRLSERAVEVGAEIEPARRVPPLVELSPFTGPQYDNQTIGAALSEAGLSATLLDDDVLMPRIAAALAAGKIVGWFDGRLEFGPRALGHRSLLADPRQRGQRERLNRKVKHRESFRPFAASILAEQLGSWFELPKQRPGARASYELMLFALQFCPGRAAAVPAVVHADGSCRIQSVSALRQPRYHALITAFAELTEVPLLLNTSFNDREPIVCSPQHAIRTFKSTDIDLLVLGSHVVERGAG